ncbi:DNA repair RAD52-like protein 2, chloroplastic [Iris pallida]|uniref:DNA repair RAD52-like protein 2, chloroplastic n=1 Tax=Iris pallida TaxID=29817 RepID=A0AAX6EKK1_IRIPA|nr:DNA repair RAD52-like protein 2, chloroplastic [Iris pallida]
MKMFAVAKPSFSPSSASTACSLRQQQQLLQPHLASFGSRRRRRWISLAVASLSAEGGSEYSSTTGGGGGGCGKSSSTVGGNKVSTGGNSNYVVPLDLKSPSFGLVRPLAEILRDLHKRVPDNLISKDAIHIPWYHANRMLSFYAPGWCGEIRDVIFGDNGSVTVLYRVTIRGSDGEAHRESTGTVPLNNGQFEDPVAAAEEIAFCRACARFGFGLHLYHEDEVL